MANRFLFIRSGYLEAIREELRRQGRLSHEVKTHFLCQVFPDLRFHVELQSRETVLSSTHSMSNSICVDLCSLELHATVDGPSLHTLLDQLRVRDRSLPPNHQTAPIYHIPNVESIRSRPGVTIVAPFPSESPGRYRIKNPSALAINIPRGEYVAATQKRLKEILLFLQRCGTCSKSAADVRARRCYCLWEMSTVIFPHASRR
jgi:hypothetical protein